MNPTRLERLLAVRREATRAGRQAMADALATEREAEVALAAANDRLAREAAIALSDEGGDDLVEAYVRWLPAGRRMANDAGAERDRAMANVALARAELVALSAAERAIEVALDARLAAIRTDETRRETAETDDATLNRFVRAERGSGE